MKLIYCQLSDIEVKKANCSLCGKAVKEGYFPEPTNNEEDEILESRLKGEPEDWFVCEACIGGLCQNPDAWLESLKQVK